MYLQNADDIFNEKRLYTIFIRKCISYCTCCTKKNSGKNCLISEFERPKATAFVLMFVKWGSLMRKSTHKQRGWVAKSTKFLTSAK